MFKGFEKERRGDYPVKHWNAVFFFTKTLSNLAEKQGPQDEIQGMVGRTLKVRVSSTK